MASNSMAVARVLTGSTWWELLSSMASKLPFLVEFFHIVKVSGTFLFSSSGGKFCCSFCLNAYMKIQQTICKERGKIISSAEPIKPWQQTPSSLSWDGLVANSAQGLASTNVWLIKIEVFTWKQKVTGFSPELWGNTIIWVCCLLSTLSSFTYMLDMLINDME